MNHRIYINTCSTDSREISRIIYIYIYINQVVTYWFKGFFQFVKGEFRWHFEVFNRLFIGHGFLQKTGRKRRSLEGIHGLQSGTYSVVLVGDGNQIAIEKLTVISK